MNYDMLALYIVVAFFYIISPGPAVFLAIYNGALNGIKPVMVSAVGNSLGLLFLSTVSISGLSAILLASSTLFTGLKITGACYLIYLGIKQFRSHSRSSLFPSTSESKGNQSESPHSKEPLKLFPFFKEGLFIASTNPKPILFFTALFPQFLDTGQPISLQFIVMTFIFMAFSFLSLTTYGFLARKAKGSLSKPSNIKWFTRISGGLFVGMGTSIFFMKSSN
ncbi:LysE family translocator [Marinomonas colpomeniae]|uniref:LysE family translocator n=1 Tax=Marinomonas colpomeniae TaxID=2774408 RepID=A0ABR8P0Q0_9GAMM|nr:LysE family translocator [Marinomonas colpomeniae]MBD5771339.1 LysE family translocator [Marinomonas colpomeniae]